MEEKLGRKVASNLSWKFAERVCAQIVSFIVTTILARILLPEDYGTIAMVNVFITFADVFVTSGLGTSLIQKKDADELDFSSMFYFGIIYSVCIYAMLFLLAPLIAVFYNNTELCIIIRIMGLRLPVACINSIQHAYVSRRLMFKKFFFSTLIGTLISAILGIVLAIKGFGAWALVGQYLTNSLIDTIVLFITVSWRPKLQFSFVRVKQLYKYGWKLLANSLIHNVYIQFKNLVVGKVYSPENLAYLNRGEQLPSLVITNVNTSIESVILPVFSKRQNEPDSIKAMVRKSTKMSIFLIWPIMMGLFITADSLITLLFTDKWAAAIPFLRISCITQALVPISSMYQQVTLAMGRSDIILKLGLPKKILSIILVLIASRYSVLMVAYVMLFQTFIDLLINIYPNIKLIKYNYLEIIKDIFPYVCIVIIMGAAIYPISLLEISTISILTLQIVIGVIVYVLLANMFRMEEWSIIRKFIQIKWKEICNRKG